MSERYYPNWMRGLDIIIGSILVIAGIWIMIDISLIVLTMLFIISFALIFAGIGRLIRAATSEGMKPLSRIMNLLAGAIAIILSMLVFIFPGLSLFLLIGFVAISLILIGVARIIIGGQEDILSSWMRGLNIIIGILSIGLGFLAMLFPGFGFLTAIFYISISLITNGFTRILSGLVGHLMRTISISMVFHQHSKNEIIAIFSIISKKMSYHGVHKI
jgi:uncharacterized membrane protein HdeD (DUF308 family)